MILCRACQGQYVIPLPERCYRCHKASSDSRVCTKCRQYSKLQHVWVATEYEELPKQVIHAFKFGRVQAAAEPISECMAATLPYLPKHMWVVHVPTATSRRRTRGYDHAELLARSIARHTGQRHSPLLARHGQTRQVGAKRHQRLTQLQAAFRVTSPDLVAGASVLLVDDLVTTGATLEEAAKCLRAAGAKRVWAVVFAQKT